MCLKMPKTLKFLLLLYIGATTHASILPVENSIFYFSSEESWTNRTHILENSNRTDGELSGKYNRKIFGNTLECQNSTYFDLTEALNRKNLSEIESALNVTSNVYYSTDKSISDIRSLEWIPKILSSFGISENEHSRICLTIGFQMTVNRSDLDWRHIQDILSTSKNNNQYDNENLLQRHLYRVVLDFQLGSIQNYSTINPSSFLYTQKWDISFTKYAKKTLKAIFQNKTVPVGVLYNEAQLDKKQSKISEILRLQEIQFADFAYVNLEYSPVIRMPLDFSIFGRNFYYLRQKNDKYLMQRDSNQGNLTYDSVDSINIQVEYMLSWKSGHSILDQFQFDKSSYKKVLHASNHEYLALFQDYVQTAMSLESSTIGVISGSIFNTQQVHNKRLYNDDDESGSRHILPSMHIQEADATTCDMLEMLSESSKPNYNAVVVNEFTWSTLVQNEAVIKEANVTNCMNYFPDEIKTPENMLLFVTRGISEHWGTINQTFINLVEDHFSVADMNLTRIVLSSDDLPEHSESEDPKRPNGMDERRIADETRATTVYDNVSEYLRALADTWKLGTGCVVDFTRENVTQPKKLFELTFKKCSPGYYRIPFFVWKYTINSTELENLLEYGEGHGENVLMRKLFTMVAARQLMKSTAPVIEVVFQIEIEETANLGYKVWNNCWMKSHEEMELEYVLEKWAQIHDVQIIRKQDVSQTPCMMYGF